MRLKNRPVKLSPVVYSYGESVGVDMRSRGGGGGGEGGGVKLQDDDLTTLQQHSSLILYMYLAVQ